jgi:hypothetical protein
VPSPFVQVRLARTVSWASLAHEKVVSLNVPIASVPDAKTPRSPRSLGSGRGEPHTRTDPSYGTSGNWRRAVQLQRERLGSSPDSTDRFVDAYLCIIALSQVLRGAEAIKRVTGDAKLRDACDGFLAAQGDATDIRDILTHFDAYERGEGTLQTNGGMGELNISFERGEDRYWIVVNGKRVELLGAEENADALVAEVLDAVARHSARNRLRRRLDVTSDVS